MALALQRFHQHFEKTVAPLSVYLKPLQSDSFAFISHLKIAGTCLAGSAELMQLPVLVKNLGVLEILEPSDSTLPFPQLSDRLVKGWSLHEDPFPKLKVLRIHTHDALSLQCLQYVTKFPALAMFEILIASMDLYSTVYAKQLARDYGWIYAKGSGSEHCHAGSGSANSQEGTSLENYQSWLGLARNISSKFWSTYADAGAQGYETYTVLEQPVLAALQEDFALGDTHLPSSPFVSLTLGRGVETIYSISSRSLIAGTMFFWRYWDHSSPDGLVSQFAPAENAVIKPTPRKPTTKAKPREEEEAGGDKRKASKPGGPIMRPRKKFRVSSVGEALSLFQGN